MMGVQGLTIYHIKSHLQVPMRFPLSVVPSDTLPAFSGPCQLPQCLFHYYPFRAPKLCEYLDCFSPRYVVCHAVVLVAFVCSFVKSHRSCAPLFRYLPSRVCLPFSYKSCALPLDMPMAEQFTGFAFRSFVETRRRDTCPTRRPNTRRSTSAVARNSHMVRFCSDGQSIPVI